MFGSLMFLYFYLRDRDQAVSGHYLCFKVELEILQPSWRQNVIQALRAFRVSKELQYQSNICEQLQWFCRCPQYPWFAASWLRYTTLGAPGLFPLSVTRVQACMCMTVIIERNTLKVKIALHARKDMREITCSRQYSPQMIQWGQ